MNFKNTIPWIIVFIVALSNIIKTKIIYNRDQTITHQKERFDHTVRMLELQRKRALKFENLFYKLKEKQ